MFFKSHQKSFLKAVFIAFLGLSVLAFYDFSAFAAKGNLAPISKDRTVFLTLGKAETVNFDEEITDILIGNPSLIEAGALHANKIYLVGTALGDTNLLVFGPNGDTIERINVHVRVDETTLQETVAAFFPEEDITVRAVNDDVILSGEVSSAAIASAVRDVANRYVGGDDGIVNLMTIAEEQQVTIKVKVVEISRDILNEIGSDVEIDGDGVLGNGSFTLGEITDAGDTTSVFLGGASSTSTALTSSARSQLDLSVDFGGLAPLSLLLDALEQDSLAKILAEPNLTARSGENARFIAGGQVPVVSNVNADGLVTFQYQPFGVVLSFSPVVLSEDRISLNISTEVSEISTEIATVVGDTPFPSFDVRRAETVVELPSGGSLMIAGLIESNDVSSLSEIPGLKEAPVLGELIKSDSFQREETELLIIISAFLAEPFANEEEVEVVDERQNRADRFVALSDAFKANIERVYGNKDLDIFKETSEVGYLLD